MIKEQLFYRVNATALGLFVFILSVFSTTALRANEEEAAESVMQGPLTAYEQFLDEVLMLDILSIPLWRLLAALGVLLLGVSLRTQLLDKILTPINALAARTKTQIDDLALEAIRKPLGWILNLFAIYFAILLVQFPEGIQNGSVLIIKSLGTIFVAWMVFRLIDAATIVLSELAKNTSTELDDQLVPLLKRILRVVLFIITGITIIQQWGYNVTSLIAGLGIGGLAFALAAQSTLSNWFGSLMIITDRPFKVGDWVKWGGGEGIVEDVGLRSTKVRTFAKTVITVPNADIATTAVENCSQMPMRRFNTTIGLVYSTSGEQVERIVEEIRELLRNHEGIDQGFWVVNFVGFGASSLDINMLAFTKTTAWAEWLEIQQEIYLKIMKIVEDNGSSFAFPSQSIYFENALEMRQTSTPPALMPSKKAGTTEVAQTS